MTQTTKIPPITINGKTFDTLEVPPGNELWEFLGRDGCLIFYKRKFQVFNGSGQNINDPDWWIDVSARHAMEWESIASKLYNTKIRCQIPDRADERFHSKAHDQKFQWTKLFEAAREAVTNA